jgi:hypothetical protein
MLEEMMEEAGLDPDRFQRFCQNSSDSLRRHLALRAVINDY